MIEQIQSAAPQPGAARWVEIENDSGFTIPAYGITRVFSATSPEPGRNVITVKQPTGNTATHMYIANGPIPILQGKRGLGTSHEPFIVAYDTGTPAVAEVWGPKNAQFTLTANGSGYSVLGNIDTTAKTMLVREKIATSFGELTGLSAAFDHDGSPVSQFVEFNAETSWNISASHSAESITIQSAGEYHVTYTGQLQPISLSGHPDQFINHGLVATQLHYNAATSAQTDVSALSRANAGVTVSVAVQEIRTMIVDDVIKVASENNAGETIRYNNSVLVVALLTR